MAKKFNLRSWCSIIALYALIPFLLIACNRATSSTSASQSAESVDRTVVNNFFRDYESFVQSAETMAERGTINIMDSLDMTQKAIPMAESAEEISSNTAWTSDDAVRLRDLSTRLTVAMAKISETANQGATDAMDAASNALRLLGF